MRFLILPEQDLSGGFRRRVTSRSMLPAFVYLPEKIAIHCIKTIMEHVFHFHPDNVGLSIFGFIILLLNIIAWIINKVLGDQAPTSNPGSGSDTLKQVMIIVGTVSVVMGIVARFLSGLDKDTEEDENKDKADA